MLFAVKNSMPSSIWQRMGSAGCWRFKPRRLTRVERVPTRALSIVLASNNRGKLAEFIELLRPYRVSLYPLARFTQTSVDETGSTFRDNALLKARYAARLAEMPAIAD